MMWVWLWTDIMVWGLVLALGAWGWTISRSPQVKTQWLAIFRSKIAMASAIVLLFYLSIALLDSLHFRLALPDQNQGQTSGQERQYAGQTTSALDWVFNEIRSQTERTYSAPFALKEHSTSIVKDEDGRVLQQHLELLHAGAHLTDPSQRAADITQKSVFALAVALAISGLLISLHLAWRSRALGRRFGEQAGLVLKGKADLPWRTAYLTFTLGLVILSWLYYLGHYYHVLGTDKVGGDVLYQSFKSVRTGVLIGVLTTLVMLPLALILGISAGLFRGWVDDVIQYVYTTLNSIPGILLIAASVLVMQTIITNNPQWFETATERADFRLLVLVLILGLTSWTSLCRLLRAETLKISQVEYVTAARAFGVSRFKIITRHILPNVMHIVLIAVVLDFSALVLAEAVLSYVGVGVDPTMNSWGNMINQARLEMAREPMVWWSLFSAFVFMFILVLAANLFSDRVQRVLDPKNN
ncbi:ABC transporter permease [Thiomicrospira cyclica]|uniref:ABC-type transporter, integral membrane subunit n=1 Tax=Thiomicrospira cyclica (strain DSM 14477 / JCM 11371 / ALM1) TaxID=717773 RepID=F6DCP0_THICA|nr:ABC transporter permease [Thiomicrospira cyclica]AEG31626.1 ABC-type transporter, integral membrane subunit [Thiomicrospira cyclica ALM1]